MNQLFRNKYFNLVIILSLLSLPFLVKVADYDIWWHLVIGREIDSISAIPETEFYIYTVLGQAASFPSWGFDLFYYSIYKYFGYYGMSIVNAVIGGSVLYLLLMSFKKQTVQTSLKIIFLCVPAYFMTSRMVHRPETFLFMFLALEIFLLEKYSENKNLKLLILIPFITFIISNMHTTAIFIISVFSVYIIQFFVEEKKKYEKHNLKLLVIIFLSSIVASCMNPYGVDQLLLLIKSVLHKQELFSNTGEYVSTLDTPYRYPFIIFSLVSIISLTIKNNRKISYFLLFCMFFFLALGYSRNISLFSIVMFVPCVKGFNELFRKYIVDKYKIFNSLLYALALILVVTLIHTINNKKTWGIGTEVYNLPSRSVQTIKRLNLSGNIFNLYRYGGYLAWELYDKHLVAVDGSRYSIDESIKTYDSILNMTDNWSVLLNYGNMNIIVLPTLNFNTEILPIIHHLSKSNEWYIVEQDIHAFTFVRSSLLKNKKFDFIDKNVLWNDVIRKSSGFTDDKKKNINLGIAYYKLKDYDKALHHMKIYKNYEPNNKSINFVIEKLEKGEKPVR